MGIPSVPQLLICLAIVIVVFGGKKITNILQDVGTSILGFKKAMREADELTNEVKEIKTHEG